MFPFKTNPFALNTTMPADQVRQYLNEKITKTKAFSSSTDDQLKAVVRKNHAIIRIEQRFLRNSFRPVAVIKWGKKNSATEIRGYYRVPLSVTLPTLAAPLFGLYLSISVKNILPALLLSGAWVLTYATFAKWLFIKDLKWVKEEVFGLLNKKIGSQQEMLQDLPAFTKNNL